MLVEITVFAKFKTLVNFAHDAVINYRLSAVCSINVGGLESRLFPKEDWKPVTIGLSQGCLPVSIPLSAGGNF